MLTFVWESQPSCARMIKRVDALTLMGLEKYSYSSSGAHSSSANASYAKLICEQSQTGITEITLDKLNDNSFTFIDTTLNNPIFNPINGSAIFIETDGTYYTCDYLYFKHILYEKYYTKN